VVAACFGLAGAEGVVWACADADAATNINVAESIDLMTPLLSSIDVSSIKAHLLGRHQRLYGSQLSMAEAKVSLRHAEF
jgi:hypothetical protein